MTSIRRLEEEKKLIRDYTQNIDGLERRAGIRKVIECHGNLDVMKCTKCRKQRDFGLFKEQMMTGPSQLAFVPHCESCGGVLKPSILFFGEAASSGRAKQVHADAKGCDMVIVIGTSLKVGGTVTELLRLSNPSAPHVLINMQPVTPPKLVSSGFDVQLLGHCDTICSYLRAEYDRRKQLARADNSNNKRNSRGRSRKRLRSHDGFESESKLMVGEHTATMDDNSIININDPAAAAAVVVDSGDKVHISVHEKEHRVYMIQ